MSHAEKLPKGTDSCPVHLPELGRRLVTLMRPPSVLRPKSALCGPRTNSICSTSRSCTLDELELSCGTPSRNVVIAGFAGLEPMPRNRGLLSFRAVNSVNETFGAKIAASLTMRMPARSIVSADTAVTLTGS